MDNTLSFPVSFNPANTIMNTTPCTLSLTDLQKAFASGTLTAQAATEACLERIRATEPHINALLHYDAARAQEAACALDRQGYDPSRPLWGVPITIKDALNTQGMPTTAGSRILENHVPFYDAFAVQKLREAGAIILGKNNMDEFAMGSTTESSAYKVTRNPWNTAHVPGGSSGGSAASVAACQCFASLGSDTGGSIRQPASLCGCVGLKPSYVRVSRHGLIAYGSSLDQLGPPTRSFKNCAQALQAIARHDPPAGTRHPPPLGN